jgi:hypothetical protein
MIDSALTMVSMTYQRACETFRFAWQNSPPGFPGLSALPARQTKWSSSRRPVPKASRLKERRQRRLIDGRTPARLGNICPPRKQNVPFDKFMAGPRGLRGASERGSWPAAQDRKRLHESAAKRLKSLARVNLRAPRFVPHHCSKLALGPASASARPTSSPRSSIEVCSRTERSSPLACRSACSGERATLTVTFDSTSGCK